MSDPMVSAASVRHYGLFANRRRVENIAHARRLLNVPAPQNEPSDADSSSDGEPQSLAHPCPSCGGRMIIIETFERGCAPRYRPTVPSRIDSSGLLSPGHHTPMLFSCRLSPIRREPIRPVSRAERQLTAAAMTISTRSWPRQATPPRYPAADPIRRSRRSPRSPLLVAVKSHGFLARYRRSHDGPRFPPLRLIRRLPSERTRTVRRKGRHLITLNNSRHPTGPPQTAAVHPPPQFPVRGWGATSADSYTVQPPANGMIWP